MKTRMDRPVTAQRGMALITSLLLLVVMTILAISMFRGYGIQEKIAGNVREKQRALNAAVSAQQFAEWSLTNGGTPPITTTCAAAVIPAAPLQICNAPLADFTSAPWGTGLTFTQFTTASGNGVQNVVTGSNSSAAKDTYYQTPLFYITDLGSAGGGSKGTVYQIDAIGFGGTDSAVAVVESTFLVSSVNSRWTDK